MILFSTTFGNYCIAQSPFKLSSPGDYITFGLTIPAFITGNSIYKNKQPLTEETILSLDAKNINWFDRSAVNQYSLKSAKVSDILAITCLLTPALLLLVKASLRIFLSSNKRAGVNKQVIARMSLTFALFNEY